MQMKRAHRSHDEQGKLLGTHNRSCDLLKPQGQVMQNHTRLMQIQAQVFTVGWRNLIQITRPWCVAHNAAPIKHGAAASGWPEHANTRGSWTGIAHRERTKVPSVKNQTTEGKRSAMLIGIPSSGSSWMSQGSHRESEMGRENSNKKHIFHFQP